MESWIHAMTQVNGIRMHYVIQGTRLLLMLLHRRPQTWYEWREVILALAECYTVVVPDLRGYGLTDKSLEGYDKLAMAVVIRAIVYTLGHKQVTLVGHDRGARVAYRDRLDYPNEVEKIAFSDIIPLKRLSRYWTPQWHAVIGTGYFTSNQIFLIC
jgi:haloacetate dehalogenase